MDLSKIKLVAADMDGTLLNAQHELSAEFFPVFDKMKEHGILFAVASGRQYFNLLNRFESTREDTIFIAENGSYVVYRGKEILVQAMAREVAMEQVQEAGKLPEVFPILCGKKTAYIQHTNPAFIENVEMYYDKYLVVEDILQIEDDEFLKIALCDMAGSEKNSYQYFKQKQDQLQVKISGSIWLDISHKLANKGRAIEVLQRSYDISSEETMVFGDFLNDLEMMQAAYYSYAMANAHPDIKRVSRYLAKSNEEDGVVIILKQMVESMRLKPVKLPGVL